MRSVQRILVTGGLGFIGSAFIRYCLVSHNVHIVNFDAETYAANPNNLNGFHEHPRYRFIQGNINNGALVEKICLEHGIDTIVHFAAETHVDRSIAEAQPFIEANVSGTASLLEVVRRLSPIHFHHISTDEVYGSLGESGSFTEHSQYRPNSPYSASKAASDHLVRAYAHTYGLSTTMSHCSNNYGPGQHSEKFIPHMILNCLSFSPLPVYGRGANVRDWIYVKDHVEAVFAILERGAKGETYNIGGNTEMTNLDLLYLLIEEFSAFKNKDPKEYRSLIRYVQDRPGHDFRYAIDSSKITSQLGWNPKTNLVTGLHKTIQYYARR